MAMTNTPADPSPARRRRRGCCTDDPCDAGLRNQYFEGKRLTAESFRVEQRYALERRRLLNRALHGWGVVHGFALSADRDGAGTLQVGAGLALDALGRELLRTRTAPLAFDDVILIDKRFQPIERPPAGSYAPRQGDSAQRACWLLSAHYAEQPVGPVRVADPCNCARDAWDHVCETVRFSLRQIGCEACCAPAGCALDCGCAEGPCCDQRDGAAPGPVGRGGCQCLCRHLSGVADDVQDGLCEIDDPCMPVRADLCNGVPLACLGLREADCEGAWDFDHPIDACGPRRLVKSSDVLFDLLRGCDLTHISAVGWADWHRARAPVGWDDFVASFGALDAADVERMRTSRDRHAAFPVVTLRYWVEFSRPVRQDTVRADCFAMTVLSAEAEGGWTATYRIPILEVDTGAPAGTPTGLVTRVAVVVDARWLYDAVRGPKTIFDEIAATVEIEIRGHLIVDCNGQTVDADTRGLLPVPTGNGTPGGTYFSSFQVQPRYAAVRQAAGNLARIEGGAS